MSQAIYTTREVGQHHRRVVLLLAGWKTRVWLYWLPARILALNGYYCIVYAYDDSVFSPDANQTVKSLGLISDAILARIVQLKKQGYEDFSIMGVSLGAMLSLMVADASPDISKVVLNLIGTGPAEAVWTWDKINPSFKQALLRQHSLASLSTIWMPIAPMSNIKNLQGKRLLVYLARNDKMIPYEQGKGLVAEIERSKYDYRLVTNRHGGHALAGSYNLINARQYLKFLSDKQ